MNYLYLLIVAFFLFSCSNQPSGDSEKITENKTELAPGTDTTSFVFENPKDTTINGESSIYHENGKVKIRGMMKNGKREGLWKSWYDTGFPWSETEFKDGKKNGKTSTWFENQQKRYEGYYTNDLESGEWNFWDEHGKLVTTKDYGNK